MNVLCKSARVKFQEQGFNDCPLQCDVVRVTPGQESEPMLVANAATLAEVEHLAQEARPKSLLLVKVLFDLPLSRLVIHASQADFLNIYGAFDIEPYGLDMIANDMTGFHCLGADSATGCYYLHCAAYRFVWAHDLRSRSTKAIALVKNTENSRRAFDECVSVMRLGQGFVSHPLYLVHCGAVQSMAFMDSLLREQYGECAITETATGMRPWPSSLGAKEGLLELSDMSRRMGLLLIRTEMVVRRVKQWKLAMDAFERFEHERRGRRLQGQGPSDDEQVASLSPAIQIMRSKLLVMEIDFGYVRSRAENQRTVVGVWTLQGIRRNPDTQQIFQMMTREEALAGIQIASTTSRDSTSMKVIAIMTMVFLPGTFFAALFAVPSLKWDADPVVQDSFWIYWAFTLPTTALVVVVWLLLTKEEALAQLCAWMTSRVGSPRVGQRLAAKAAHSPASVPGRSISKALEPSEARGGGAGPAFGGLFTSNV